MNRRTTLTAVALSLVLAGAALPADAASAADGSAHKQTRTAKARSSRIKMAPSHDNGESAADRDRRFRRECRGLPNAGACQGYGYGS